MSNQNDLIQCACFGPCPCQYDDAAELAKADAQWLAEMEAAAIAEAGGEEERTDVRSTVQAHVSAAGCCDQERLGALLDALDECAAVAADENEHGLKVALRALIDGARSRRGAKLPRRYSEQFQT